MPLRHIVICAVLSAACFSTAVYAGTARVDSTPVSVKRIPAQSISGRVDGGRPVSVKRTPAQSISGRVDGSRPVSVKRTPAQSISGRVDGGRPVSVGVQKLKDLIPGLVGYWPMDGDWKDKSGNEYNGTASGGAAFSNISGVHGTDAGSFDGTDDYVTVATTPIIADKSEFTIAAWIKADTYDLDPVTGWHRRVYSEGGGAMYFTASPGGRAGIGVYGSNNVWSNLATQTMMDPGEWNHVVFTRDSAGMKVYLNGALDNSIDASIPTSTRVISGVYIGKTTSGTTSGSFYDGLIDELALFGRALSPDEVNSLYLNGIKTPLNAPAVNPVITPTADPLLNLSGTKDPGTSVWLNGAEVAPAGISTEWQTTYTLIEGPNTLKFSAHDNSANVSEEVRIDVVLDTIAPVSGSVSIGGGAASTKDANVALQVSATDAGSGLASMQFSNDGETWPDWIPYAATASWSLTPGDGDKTVYAKVMDKAGNISAAISDAITLDTVKPPAPEITDFTAPTGSASQTISGAKAAEAVSVKVTLNGAQLAGVSATYPTPTTWTAMVSGLVEGENTVSVTGLDDAGNESEDSAPVTILLDKFPPVWQNKPGVRFVEPGDGTAVIRWDGAEDVEGTATSYNVYVSDTTPVDFSKTSRLRITDADSVAEYYRADSDFSTTQGYRNWYYYYWNGSSYLPMTFDTANSRWKGPDTYILIWNNGGHPVIGKESARAWRAPADGYVNVTGKAYDANSNGGDGVRVSIWKNDAKLWEKDINNGNATGYDFNLQAAVATGDKLYFRINCKNDSGADGTYFNPEVVFSHSGASLPAEGYEYQCTLSGLSNNTPRYFAVRTIDAFGNEDNNAITLKAVPQTTAGARVDYLAEHWTGTMTGLTVGSDGSLSIAPGAVSGTYESPYIDLGYGNSLSAVSFNSVSDAALNQAVEMEVDDGSGWTAVTDGQQDGLPAGQSVRYRVTLTGDGSASPVLRSVSLAYNDFVALDAPSVDSFTSPTKLGLLSITGSKEAGASVWINGAEVVPSDVSTAWGATVTLTKEGDNAFSAYSRDAAGNQSQPVYFTVVRDTTAPSLVSSSPSNGSANSVVANIGVSLADASSSPDLAASATGAKVMRGTSEVAGTWSVTGGSMSFSPADALSDGSYTVSVYPVDTLGNRAASPSTFGFVVDTAVPTVTISMNPPSPHRAETVAFTLSFSEAMDVTAIPALTFGQAEPFNAYVIGGGVWSVDKRSFTASFAFSQLVPEGGYTLQVSGAKDLAGNQMAVSRPAAFELDMTPPAVPTMNEAASPTKTSTVALFGTKDSGSSVVVNGAERVPAGPDTAWSYQYLLAEGANDLRVTSKDASGNESAQTTPAPRVVLDTTPPDFTVNYTTPSANTTQVLSGTKEPGCVLKVDGVTVAAETDMTPAWSYEVTLSNGLSNKLTLTASDALGNTKTKTISILCDANAPSPLAPGVLEAYGEGDGASVTLKWTAYNEALVPDLGYYRVYVSTSGFPDVSGIGPLNTTNKGVRTYTVTGLEPGRMYWFAVIPVDQNGNFDTTVNCVSAVPSDTKAPEEVTNLAATAAFDGATGVNSVNLAWTKSVNIRKDLATQKVYFDGGNGYDAGTDIGPDAASYIKTGLEDDAHVKFRLTVTDLTGNESAGRAVEATTRIANPAVITAVPGNGKADVSWSKVSSLYLKEYRVYITPGVAPLGSASGMTLVKITTATSASISGLTNGEAYQVAVTSVNTSLAENTEVASVPVSPRSDADGPSITAFDVKVGGVAVTAGSAVVKPSVVTVAASDAESAMFKVELYVDGTLALSQTGGSLSYNWDVIQTNDGSHTLTVKAYDAPGNVTVLDKTYVVSLAPPSAPSITGHVLNSGSNPPTATVTGSCMAGTTVALIVEGVVVTTTATAQNGAFQFTGVALEEGVNSIYAKASHRGGESPLSARYDIVVDTGSPEPPSGLSAKALPGGAVRLTWSAGAGETPAGYNLYASAGTFSSKDGAGVARTNASPIKYALTDYKPQNDSLRYYAVTSVDAAGNESAMSGVVSAASDRTSPAAVSIKYRYTASGGTITDPAQTAGPGKVDVSLTVSEPLGETPFFSLTPSSGSPVVVSLSKTDDTHWKGEFPVTSLTPHGQTQYRFTGKDVIGNRGEAGGSGITIDVKGPVASVLEPASLLKITGQPVTVKAAFDEPPVGLPALELVDNVGAPVRVLGLTDDGDGLHFTGSVDISGMAEGEARFNLTSAVDRFGNHGDTVASGGSVLLYINLPPAPPVPEGLAVKSEKGGKLSVTWKPVSGALSYKLYRSADGETEPELLQGGLTLASAVDIPEADGEFYYSVASVGQLSSESAKSAEVSAVSDRTPPSAPSGLALTFGAGGVSATWTAPEGEAPASYNLYRSSTQISSISGLTPAVKGIKALKASDPSPVSSIRYYVVTAMDALGNEGSPSASGYITFPVAPPRDLMLIRLEGTAPVLVWEEPQAGVAYNIYRNGSKLTSSPSSQTAYTDAAYDGGKVVYGVSAVDGYGNESPVKEVSYSGFEAGLAPDVTLNRGYIQKLPVLLVNPGDAGVSVDEITLRVGSAVESTLAGPFEVAAGSTLQVEKIGSTSLDSPSEVAVSVTAEWSPSPGVTVMVSNSRTAVVAGAGATMEVYSDPLVRGTNAKVRLKIYNNGDSDMDFVTSENGGATSKAVITLKDEDGNVLAQGRLNQRADFSGNIINGASYAVARIAPGESFTTDEITFPVPTTAPYAVVIDASISGTYYHYGKPEQVSAPGISQTVPANINETAYRGQVSVAQAFYPGPQPVLITGSAVNNNTNAPMPLVPVVIGVSVKGFDRYFTVNSDASGNFSYTFKPGANEAGIYSVWARHPDVSGRSVQATFTIAGLQMSPTTASVKVLRGSSFDIPMTLKNIGDTPITGMSYTVTAGSGVSGTVINGPVRVDAGKTVSASFRVSAAGDAPDVSTVKLDVRTAEGPSDRLDTTVIMVSAIPIINVTPKSYVDTGVVRGDQRLESLTLTNTGAGTLKNARVEGPALSWITLATAREIGDVPPGGKVSMAVMFSPDASVPQKVYNDSLTITSDNHIPYRVNLQCTVVTNAAGSAQFDVMNSFGEKVKGASIRIQNAQLTELVYTKSTDALGTELFADIPAGSYVYTVSASGCKPYSASFEVLPGVVVLVPVALEVNTVEVEFTVTPVVIEDRYEITVTQTFKTDVPVPVLVVEPRVINLPPMKSGQVYNGEFTVTNYGLIDGENFTFTLPSSIGNKVIEYTPISLPRIKAKQSVSIPFRVIMK